MKLTLIAAVLALAAMAAEAPTEKPKPLTKEQAQALEILDLKFQRDSALMEKLTAQINQYRAEYNAITAKACTDAGFKECTVANGMITPKPVEVAAAPAKPAPTAKGK